MRLDYTPSDIARFWSKVDRSNPDGCWLWTAGRSHKYGKINIQGHSQTAHRMAFEITYGPIPSGLSVFQNCGQLLCVRHDHLVVGTDAPWTPPSPEWSVAELAYLAAMIDGEGSVCIIRRIEKGKSVGYRLRLFVTNTNAELMEWITGRFGGRVHSQVKPSGTTVFQWVALERAIDTILPAVFPYMIVKRRQAEIAFRYREGYRHYNGGDVRISRLIDAAQEGHRERCWLELGYVNSLGGKSRKGPKTGWLAKSA